MISIIIPNFNGKNLLKRNLPNLLKVLKKANFKWEIIIVDDGSTDGSVSFLRENFKEIKVIEKPHTGFADSLNKGAKVASYDILYFMNSDIEVFEDFLTPLLSHFKSKKVFAVGSAAFSKEGKLISSKCELIFKRGLLDVNRETVLSKDTCECDCVSAGHSAFSKKIFLKLNGFDTLFYPFYFEDVDLCYRAKILGYKILFEPRSKVIHPAGTTISKYYDKRKKEIIHRRNKLLFNWCNLSFKKLFLHIILLPLYFLKISFFISFLYALSKLPYVYKRRRWKYL